MIPKKVSKNNKSHDFINKQSYWCIQNNLLFTPMIIINSKVFPEEYNQKDIGHYIGDLLEN